MERVWIAEGCIACRACEYACPAVFTVSNGGSRIRAEVRLDGRVDENRFGQSPLLADAAAVWSDGIAAAADACPVSVICIADGAPSPVI